MQKKWLAAGVIVLVLIVSISAIVYFTPEKKEAVSSNSQQGSSSGSSAPVKSNNPVAELTDDQAVEVFNSSFVSYLLRSIGAQDLHTAPFSSDLPRIEVVVNDDYYTAEIEDKRIRVSTGSPASKDIIIRTTKAEAVKMLRNRSYVVTSFQNGGSGIELVASKSTLFGKGYLTLYNKLTGKD